MSSLANDIRSAFASGGDTPSKTTLINYNVDQSRLPASVTLTPAEQRQLVALKQHMRLVAKHDAFDASKEGSLAGMVNGCTPNVRAAIALSREYSEQVEQAGGRTQLFEPRKEMPKPDALDQRIIDRDAHERIVGGIHDRMGTAEKQERINDREPSIRDYVDASFDAQLQGAENHG